MPINATLAKLWFATKEEEQHYDDLMMANIEHTQDQSIEEPNFTFINTKPRAERFFTFTPRAVEQMAELERLERQRPAGPEPSLAYMRELPLLMTGTATFLGYLVLRELPIRNFYARAFIMTLYGGWLYGRHRFLGSHRGIASHVKINYDAEIFKVHEQFHDIGQVMKGTRVNSGTMPPTEARWRLLQPGYYRPGTDDMPKSLAKLRRSRLVDWDGTFNQPVLPLLSPLHRDMKGTIF